MTPERRKEIEEAISDQSIGAWLRVMLSELLSEVEEYRQPGAITLVPVPHRPGEPDRWNCKPGEFVRDGYGRFVKWDGRSEFAGSQQVYKQLSPPPAGGGE